MNLNSFKTYDIRGIYGSEIDEELAYKIGLQLPTLFNTDKIVIGMDARTSSPSLKANLIKGIIEAGCNVLDIDIVTTPMLSFAVASLNLKGGVMISASHNGPEYNAFKLIGERARQLSLDTGINKLKELVQSDSFVKPQNLGVVEKISILESYQNHLLSIFKINKKVKIVCDYGNGVGSVSAVSTLEKFSNIQCTHLYKELDGTFPNHLADPHHLENMQLLINKVIEEKADVGIFFDGDADRCYFINEKGEVILADITFCLLCENELKKSPNSNKTIYFDLRFTKEIVNVIKNNGGSPVMMRVGNPFYKEKLIKEGGLMASEFSGHIMYNQNFNIDDGLFAALKMIELLSSSDQTLSKLTAKYATYASIPEMSILVEGKDIDKILLNLKEQFKDGNEIIMDGLYIEYPNWWFNLRRSNTEPVVRLRIEAKDVSTLDLQKQKILNIINS